MPEEIDPNPSQPDFPPPPGVGGPGLAAGPTEPLASTDSEFRSLDPRVITLWRLQQTISSFILLSLALVVGGVVALANPGAQVWVGAAWAAFAGLRLFLLIWYPSRAFKARGYRLDAKVLETRRGIWFRVITLLPLSRLQHVDLNRGPLERMFGLASLVLYTAGTQHAMVIIPGLDQEEAGRLRDHLVAVGGDDAV